MKGKSHMQPKQSRDRGGRQGRLEGAREAKLSQARLLDITLENVHLPVKRQRGWRLEPARAGDAGSAEVAGTQPGEAEEHSGGSPLGAGAGGPGTRGRHAHTQRILNVDQPAVKSEKLGDQDQLIGHRPVRALVPGQEGLAEPLPVFPFSDESPCGAGEKRGRARGSFPLLPSNSQGVVPAPSASLSPAKKLLDSKFPVSPDIR